MNLVSIKAAKELDLAGISIDITKEDTSIKELRLQDGKGSVVVVRASSYGDVLKILVPQPPVEEERWAVIGKFLDVVEVRDVFDKESDADKRLREYEIKAHHHETGLTVKRIMVKVDDAGAEVGPAEDLPF